VAKPWIEDVERRVARWLARRTSHVWVVAVSGGGDSVGLLRVLSSVAEPLGLVLSVAHLDHGVRGEAARADAAFVAELARSLGLPLDLGRWQPARAGHFEADARRARYDWLTQVAGERGAGTVAAGHTRDDQAEKILHRILRGTGPRGLSGIPARRTMAAEPRLTLVRPLLEVSRREIREFLSTIGQPFREDETNAALGRTRSRIRHDLLPKLAAEYNPAVGEALVRLGSLSASLKHAVDRDARAAAREATVSAAENAVVLKLGFLRSTPRSMQTEILRRVWRRAGWPEASMSALRWHRLAALIGKKEVQPRVIGARVEVSSDGLFLVLRRLPKTPAPVSSSITPVEIPLALPGRTEVPWAGCSIHAATGDVRTGDPAEVVDFDQVAGRLFVRRPAPGDRLEPLGMGGKTMVLADFFRGRRVPHELRTHIPLVCDQVGIIWVVGHRIAERVKATNKTEHVLSFSVSALSAVPTGGK
jgi:tRNA(Ile)-lysidine synthase